jgi:pyrroloquinoline quinone (PQQ) biosynthesis protein C
MSLAAVAHPVVAPTDKLTAFLEDHRGFVLDHPGTRHPFLEAYSTGGLSAQQTRICFLEFYQFINKYPFYLSILGGRLEDMSALQEIIRINADEVAAFRGKPHLQIYREFLNALGVSDTEIDQYQPQLPSLAINEHVRNAYLHSPVAEAVGALFGLETMASHMMYCLDQGLRVSGYSDAVRFFFTIHVELEKNHAEESFEAAKPLFRGDELSVRANEVLFEKGLREFMGRLDGFWSGVGARCDLAA